MEKDMEGRKAGRRFSVQLNMAVVLRLERGIGSLGEEKTRNCLRLNENGG
jgi:hypothetical protein